MVKWTEEELLVVIFHITFFIIWAFIVYGMWKKRNKNDNPLTRYLFLLSVAYLFYPIQVIDYFYFDTFFFEDFGYKLSLGNALAIAATGFGHYYFISFAAIVYNGTSYTPKKKILIKILELIICPLYLLFKIFNLQTLAIILLGGHMIIGFYIFIYIFFKFVSTSKNAEDPAVKKSFTWIAISAINLIITYGLIFLDGLVDPNATTYFSVAGVFSGIIIAFEIYLGYIHYPTLVKRKIDNNLVKKG